MLERPDRRRADRKTKPNLAEKYRRYRERMKADECCVRLVVDVHVRNWLIEKKFLKEWDAENREAVRAALQQAIFVLSSYEF
jgi:hypothetical protein